MVVRVGTMDTGERVVLFFFFQAEDGIRDLTVTGVQTCALPILGRAWQVLALLEAGHHVAHQAPPVPPDAAQLGLFNPSGSPHPLLEELDRLDVNALSPLEALNRLAAREKTLAGGP